MEKPRFNRSGPKVLAIEDLLRMQKKGEKKIVVGRLSESKTTRWRPITIKTLGFLAAKGKVNVLQVHQCMGDKSNKVFRDSFLDNIDLEKPSDQDMNQLKLFSHFL